MRFLLACVLAGLAVAPAAAVPGDYRAATSSHRIEVAAIAPEVIRVRAAANGASAAEDASWAVPATVRARRAATRSVAGGFTTAALDVRIGPRTLALTIADRAGRVVHRSGSTPLTLDAGGYTLRAAIGTGERFFGLGDKTGGFDRRGHAYVNWNTDAWGYGRATDPLYKSIPFFVSVGGEGGAYGVFLDEPGRSWFDFGRREADVLAIGGAGTVVDYYVIAGPTLPEVVRRYAELTGKPPLPPRWALGFHQSRYSYMSDAEVRAVARRLRTERVPADVLWLDIDFQDRNRPFTTDPRAYPDLPALARDLRADGLRLVAITDLHIAHAPGQGYAPYDSGTAGDHWVKGAHGRTYVAPVWPGPSVFPDFTRVATRAWWGGLYRGFVDDGVSGFWNDMNEPAVFETPSKTMPADNRHRVDGDGRRSRTATHAEVHNVYGMENSRATYEGLMRLRPDIRPYVLTRATFAGGQRYAATWTGDNSSTADHLKLTVEQVVNLGLSGFTHAGADIGGFIGGASPDLMTRWYQIGAFTPVFRSHAAKDAPRAEPWVDGPEHLAIRRRFIEERYRLMPTFYALAERASRTGDPIVRPVFYDHPSLLGAPCDPSAGFALGRDLLIAPTPTPESARPYEVCLPADGWYDYWTGHRVETARPAEAGGVRRVTEVPQLERLPIFVRPGAIVVRQPLAQSTAAAWAGPLQLDIYPGPDCRGEIYWDDGETFAYRRGDHLRRAVRCRAGPDGVRMELDRQAGAHRPPWREIAVTVHGWTGAGRVRAGGRAVAARPDPERRALRFTLPERRGPVAVDISRS